MNSNSALNFAEVRDKVNADDEGKWDAVVLRDELALHGGKVIFPESYVGDYANQLTPTAWATAQMCGRLGIPTAYFRRCPTHLQNAQFNHWTRHADAPGSDDYVHDATRPSSNGLSNHMGTVSGASSERWLMRAKHDSLRGVLSDRYAKLDNEPFLRCVEPLLDRRFQVKWFSLSDESLHLRLMIQRTPVLPTATLELMSRSLLPTNCPLR